MIINTTDAHMGIFAGITVFNDAGKPMSRVQEIDTETLCCSIGPFGKTAQAAGFVIIPNRALFEYVPDGLFPFVCPIVDPTPEQLRKFIDSFLDHRRTCSGVALRLHDENIMGGAPEGTRRENVVNTFSWPREPFVAMADKVKPSEEEEKRIDLQRLKEGKTGVVQEEPFRLKGTFKTPWEKKPRSFDWQVSSLWFFVKEDDLVQWGIGVSTDSPLAVVGNVLDIEGTESINMDKIEAFFGGQEEFPAYESLFEKKWTVIGSRGKPNKTIEIMCQNIEESKL